jgi:UDP-N-acetylmuramoyl-tripeptide--D-alanyl-D-alanine ligase
LKAYYTGIELLLYSIAVIILWHSWFRARYFLQVFQQNGYHINEYTGWMGKNWAGKLIGNAHIIIIPIFLIEVFGGRLTMTAITIILFLFIAFLFIPARREYSGVQKKPLVFTPRMIRLAGPVAVFYLFFPWLGYNLAWTAAYPTPDALIFAFSLILADLLLPFYILLAAILVSPVEKYIQNGFKKQARRKLQSMPGLRVIAITGSYGKTSTKFIIKTLLEERFNVCFTPGSYNTPMGICKVINNDLNAGHQILILEMGARYEGNIDELCEIARPDVAVVTNVGKAHLETFGDIETIARTKSAIIRHLKQDGTAVINADDPLVMAMPVRGDISVLTAGITAGDFRASDIRYDEQGCRFNVSLPVNRTTAGRTADRTTDPTAYVRGNIEPNTGSTVSGENDQETGQNSDSRDHKDIHNNGANASSEKANEANVQDTVEITSNLLGAHNVQNMLLGIATGHAFGLRMTTMQIAAQRVEPVEHRLELKRLNGLLVIDDAFNSNPVGARNAVDVLAMFKTGRRVIITPGMVELGEEEEKENREFGRHIGGRASIW